MNGWNRRATRSNRSCVSLSKIGGRAAPRAVESTEEILIDLGQRRRPSARRGNHAPCSSALFVSSGNTLEPVRRASSKASGDGAANLSHRSEPSRHSSAVIGVAASSAIRASPAEMPPALSCGSCGRGRARKNLSPSAPMRRRASSSHHSHTRSEYARVPREQPVRRLRLRHEAPRDRDDGANHRCPSRGAAPRDELGRHRRGRS